MGNKQREHGKEHVQRIAVLGQLGGRHFLAGPAQDDAMFGFRGPGAGLEARGLLLVDWLASLSSLFHPRVGEGPAKLCLFLCRSFGMFLARNPGLTVWVCACWGGTGLSTRLLQCNAPLIRPSLSSFWLQVAVVTAFSRQAKDEARCSGGAVTIC